MTLHDVQRLMNHWRRSPPLRILVASCAVALGVKLPNVEQSSPSKYLNADEARRLFGATDGLNINRMNGIG